MSYSRIFAFPFDAHRIRTIFIISTFSPVVNIFFQFLQNFFRQAGDRLFPVPVPLCRLKEIPHHWTRATYE